MTSRATRSPFKSLSLLTAALLLLLFSGESVAAPLVLDIEELPAESVVPILDSNMAVKNRLVPQRARLEVGTSLGSVIDEMFFSSSLLGINLFYHNTEETAWGLKYLMRSSELGTYAEQFSETSGQLDFTKAPAPGAIIAGAYRWSFLYGKMSFSKNLVLPTIFSVETDFGINKIGNQNLPFTAVGLSHKLVMRRQIGVALSYRWLIYQTIDPVSADLRAGSNPTESDFSKKLQISQSIDLGLSWLF